VAALPEAAFEVAARAALAACGLWDDAFETSRREWFLGVLRLIQPRVKLLAAIPEEGRFFFDPADNFAYDAQGMKKHWGDPAIAAAVGEVAARWDALHDWSPVPLEAELRAVADARGVSAGKLIHPVRLAVTGRTASPGLFEVVALLGRERTRARLGRLLDWPTTGLL
jgi:glutamyl-tRNA synthetase